MAMSDLDGGMFRAEVDLFSGARWTAGIGVALGTQRSSVPSPFFRSEYSVNEANEVRLLAHVGRTIEVTPNWHVRASFAVGINVSDNVYEEQHQAGWDEISEVQSGRSSGIAFESSLLVSRTIGHAFAVIAGPVLGVVDRRFTAGNMSIDASASDISVLVGGRYRL
jgi:hypothetical protein